MAAAPAISSSGFKLNFLTIIPVINIKPVATAANAITRPPNAAALANKATLIPAGGGGTLGGFGGVIGGGVAAGFSPPNPNILARNPMIPPVASGLAAFAFGFFFGSFLIPTNVSYDLAVLINNPAPTVVIATVINPSSPTSAFI